MKNCIIKYRKGKYKGIKIEWLRGKQYQITWLGNNESVMNFDFRNKGKIYCRECGKIHFDFANNLKLK